MYEMRFGRALVHQEALWCTECRTAARYLRRSILSGCIVIFILREVAGANIVAVAVPLLRREGSQCE